MLIPLLIFKYWRRKPGSVTLEPLSFGFVTASGLDLDPEHRGCMWLPASFMRSLVPDSTFNTIARLERDYVASIACDIEENGLQTPLIIVMDGDGVCLRDGHHRVVAGVLDSYPVQLERSALIRKHKVPLQDLVDVLWQKAL